MSDQVIIEGERLRLLRDLLDERAAALAVSADTQSVSDQIAAILGCEIWSQTREGLDDELPF